MIKIGLIGEDPYDTTSLKNLLIKKFSSEVHFKPLIKNIRGFYLDNAKTKKSLKVEFEHEKPKFVIFIRDLDGLPFENKKIEEKKNWFNELDTIVNKCGIFLLNIFELEALIFADIDTFNVLYKTSIKGNRDPMFIKEPKEELIRKTRQNKDAKKIYTESHAPDIFEKLNFDNVENKCKYFKEFIAIFNAHLFPKKKTIKSKL